jgi:metal-sulfur cluster biosynthetic enzyme
MIVQWVEEAVLRELPNAQNAAVEVVWEPVWNISMATEDVKRQLSGGL